VKTETKGNVQQSKVSDAQKTQHMHVNQS